LVVVPHVPDWSPLPISSNLSEVEYEDAIASFIARY
jgi:hypothetical protein